MSTVIHNGFHVLPGLLTPDEVKVATKEYRSSQDVVGSFLRDRCKRADDAWTANPVLYQAYGSWCESNGEKPVSQKVLSGLLERHGYVMKRTRSGRGWKRLRIRAEELIT